MGGDHGPRVIVSALLESLSQHSNVKALLFGDRDELASQLKNCSDTSVVSRIEVRHSDCCVADTDKPSTVIRNKRDSSMGLALQALANNEADAFVSAGNTGAMMALGLYYVKPLAGYLASGNLHRDSDINGSQLCARSGGQSRLLGEAAPPVCLARFTDGSGARQYSLTGGETAQCW